MRCIHSVITSSMSVPTHSVSFPLDRSDKDNVAVMVSTIHKFGNSPISAVIWLYLDGCISSAYNSASKGNIMYCQLVSCTIITHIGIKLLGCLEFCIQHNRTFLI